MKAKSFFTFVLIILFVNFNASAEVYQSVDDSVLYNVQEKIYSAFLNSFEKQSMDGLETIEQQLQNIDEQNKIVNYWIAYTNYYQSIYQITMGNKKGSEKSINEGIDELKKIKNKSSDDYALLSMLQGFSTQFSSGSQTAKIGYKAKENAQKAIEMDKKNVRAWYVAASNNAYAPKAFGGGTKVEEYLKKALALEEQNINNPYLPTWGKKEAYRLLVGFYMKQERYKDAKKVLSEGLEKYPDNYMLNQYKQRLAEH